MGACESSVAWCHSVIRHAAITEIRRMRHRLREVPLSCLDADRLRDQRDAPSEAAARAFADSDVRLLLRSLPQAEQTVLRLLYLTGMSQQETAGRLGWPQQQVSLVHRHALATLRRSLE